MEDEDINDFEIDETEESAFPKGKFNYMIEFFEYDLDEEGNQISSKRKYSKILEKCCPYHAMIAFGGSMINQNRIAISIRRAHTLH